MNIREFISIAVLIVVFFHGDSVFSQNAEGRASHKSTSNTSIIFMSDTQSPMKVETLWLKYTDNDIATDRIYSAVALESNAAAVFHLGDIAAIGSSNGQWDAVEKQLAKLRQAKLPFYPIPGNHDYMFSTGRGMENFRRIFPEVKRMWYEVRVESVSIILLNSNFSDLSDEELSQQRVWYEEQLARLDKDPSVSTIIVATHHPPYTNSKIVRASTGVQKEFVPLFNKYGKCRLFISGHSHAFEHFRQQGKDFLVIGGGGGLLHPLRTGDKQKWQDLFPEKTDRRFFHYITCEIQKTGILVSVRRLNTEHSGFETPYAFQVPQERK